MKVIVKAGRNQSEEDVLGTINMFPLVGNIDEVMAAKGDSTHIKAWADKNRKKFTEFEIDWNNINVPGAVVKENARGKYNAMAGADTMRKMLDSGADALIVVTVGAKDGTESAASEALKRSRIVWVNQVAPF